MQAIDVVVGGQYGSEAKGHVTAQLVAMAVRDVRAEDTPDDLQVINVRVAGPNAGHTVYDAADQKFAFRQIPVGAVIDPIVKLYIAPGSEIDLDVLYSEIDLCETTGHSLEGRLFISRQATIIDDSHKRLEASLVGRVGSTGKGIGAARASRLMREARTMGDHFADADLDTLEWAWAEPEDLYATDALAHDANIQIIVEGTQGYGLGLHAGHYPQVTSSDARSVDFLAMAGIDPTRCSTHVQNWVVCRVFPIRVAGNSGPMKGETSWEELGLEEERTTVTQKVRRVGEWDPELVARAVQANGGHNAKVIITMLDQVIPELAEMPYDVESNPDQDHPALIAATEWLNANASPEQIGAAVGGITFGPTKILFTPAAQPDTGAQDLNPAIAQALQNMFAGIAGDEEEATDGR